MSTFIKKRNISNYNKPAFWVIAIAVIACVAAAVFLPANPAKTLELPTAASVHSMDMEQFNEYESLGPVSITDSGSIENVLSALSGARKTFTPSVNDYPTQNNYLVVRLNLSGERRTLCLYTEGNVYYIEEPYVGVYRSSRDASVAIYKIYNGGSKDVYALATAYAFDKCLYMHPASSYYPFEGTKQLYLCDPDSFKIVNEETGEIQESYSLIDWQAKKVDTDEWNGMFWNEAEAVDISPYKSRIEYNIGSNYRLYQMDGEVWLGHFVDTLWSLYRLKETDISTSGTVSRKEPNISENKTLRVDSPDRAYRAEAYGTDKGITAAGRYPYEGLRVIRNSDETTVWNGEGYYRAEFLWSNDSKYVAVYREARIYGECFVVAADTGEIIKLPDMGTVSAQLDVASQPATNRPDPYFKAMEWVDDTTIHVNYRWISQEGKKEVSGTYEYDIINGDIVSNTSKISDSPG